MLPHIDRPIDNTALSMYMTCPREFFYSMMLHRRSDGSKSPALAFGSAWHKALEAYYRTGGDVEAGFELAIQSWEEHGSTDDYRTLERVLLDFKKYAAKFKPGTEDEKTIGFPHAPLVEVAANVESGGLVHPYAGLLDRIIRLDGLVYVQDHKTTSRLDKHYFRQYDMSPQMLGYVHLAQQLLPTEKVVGVQINVSHVLTAKTEFHRQLVTYSPARLAEWVFNTNLWMQRMNRDYALYKAEAQEAAHDNPEAIEEGIMPFPGDGKTESFPGHYGDNGCSRKYGMCGYAPVCSVAARIRRRVLEQDYTVEVWNPLRTSEAETA